MKIAVVGAGYVGLTTASCLSKLGHDVICCDIDSRKVSMVNKGESPIYEPGLDLSQVRATLDMDEAIRDAEVVFVCVGTKNSSGETVLTNLEKACEQIAVSMSKANSNPVIVIKSTTPPGTTHRLRLMMKRICNYEIEVVCNPEFLREGRAVHDFMNPDKIVVGYIDQNSIETMKKVYVGMEDKIFPCSLKEAEMIKYASNAKAATNVSMANEIANICKTLGIDSEPVMRAISLDAGIRYAPDHFKVLKPGIGWGGSCLPPDLNELISLSSREGYEPELFKSVISINKKQPRRLINLAEKKFGSLKNKNVCCLGLSFKPGTDDVRESQAIKVVKILTEELPSKVIVHDPKAMENAKRVLGNSVKYAHTASECVAKAKIVFLLVPWDEYKDATLYTNKKVVDGWGVLKNLINLEKTKYISLV